MGWVLHSWPILRHMSARGLTSSLAGVSWHLQGLLKAIHFAVDSALSCFQGPASDNSPRGWAS